MYSSNQRVTSFLKITSFSTICFLKFCFFLTLSPKAIYANDLYTSMTELMEDTEEGSDWEITYNNNQSNALIAAIHGGNIEPGTSEVAKLTATKGHIITIASKAFVPRTTQVYM